MATYNLVYLHFKRKFHIIDTVDFRVTIIQADTSNENKTGFVL